MSGSRDARTRLPPRLGSVRAPYWHAGGSNQENESVPAIDPPHVRITDLADGVPGGAGGLTSLDDAGQVRDPLVIVDLDGAASPEAVARAADRSGGGGRLLVGVASQPPPERLRPLLAALDLTLVPAAGGETAGGGPGIAAGSRVPGAAAASRESVAVRDPLAEAQALAATAAGVPQAAVVLGQVLRAAETLPVPAALDVESFAYSTLLGGSTGAANARCQDRPPRRCWRAGTGTG
jgi:hypothetical protein